MTITYEKIKELLDPSLCGPTVLAEYVRRVEEDNLTRDEDQKSHFCTYFLPYNPATRQVFLIHHKKSGYWMSPGGHIDKGETPLQGLEREVREELGIPFKPSIYFKPFFLTITQINNPKHPCRTHYDIWYGIETDGSNFNIDPAEFYASRWMTIPEARGIVTETANLQALDRVERDLFN